MSWRSVYLKTLRDGRAAVLGWGLGIGLLVLIAESSVGSVLAAPGAKQALAGVAQSFSWAADPVAVTTVGGYTTWKLGFTVLIMAIWPLIASVRILRGAEERGTMDVLLSVPRSRLRVALESVAAIWTSLLAMGLLVALLTYVGGRLAHAGFGPSAALLFGLNLAVTCGVFGSFALVISQFTQQARTASGATGGVLFVAVMLDMLQRTIPGTTWLSSLSPVYYYNLSKPLVPSFGVDPWAMLGLLSLSVVLTGVAVGIFVRRDMGRSAVAPPDRSPRAPVPTSPQAAWSLRSLYTRGLATVVAPTLWWTLAMAGFAAFAMLATKQLSDQLMKLIADTPAFRLVLLRLGGGAAGANQALLSALFSFLPLLIMVFAVTQASRWGSDEEEGRQDLILATPRPRRRVLLARFAAVASAGLFIGIVTLVVASSTAAAVGLTLQPGHLVAATLALVPQFLLMTAIGYLAAGWLATALETGLLSFLLAGWFVIAFVGPELGWSSAVLKLSAFTYYGTPLVHGVAVGDTAVVLAVTATALGFAVVRFARKDIGRFWR